MSICLSLGLVNGCRDSFADWLEVAFNLFAQAQALNAKVVRAQWDSWWGCMDYVIRSL